MAAADDIFRAARDPLLGREAQQRVQQDAFEVRVVKRLLRHAGIELNTRAVHASWDGVSAVPYGLKWLTESYPRFPVYLGTSKLKFTSGSQIGWTQLFGSGFMKLPWVTEYQKLCAQYDWNIRNDRVGLCFNVPHAPGASVMVFHNQPIQAGTVPLADPERRTEPETRILRPFGPERIVFVLESLDSFLTTVGTDWAT